MSLIEKETEAALWGVFEETFSKCDMCGSTEVVKELEYPSCKEHAHIPPVFRMELE